MISFQVLLFTVLSFLSYISDHYVFVRKFSDDDFIILLVYVDDMVIVGKNVSRIVRLKKQLGESFVKGHESC